MSEVTWDEALKGQSDFLKLETGKRVSVAITDWTIVQEEVKKYQSEETEIKPVFKARVVGYEGASADMKINTPSKRLMGALRPHLEGVSTDEVVFVSIKKIGEATDTNYDVEEAEGFAI